jgi:hypothetical protein
LQFPGQHWYKPAQGGPPNLNIGLSSKRDKTAWATTQLHFSHFNGTRMIDGDDAGRFILSKVSLEKN